MKTEGETILMIKISETRRCGGRRDGRGEIEKSLFRFNPDASYLGTYEGKIAAQKRREIQAMIELK